MPPLQRQPPGASCVGRNAEWAGRMARKAASTGHHPKRGRRAVRPMGPLREKTTRTAAVPESNRCRKAAWGRQSPWSADEQRAIRADTLDGGRAAKPDVSRQSGVFHPPLRVTFRTSSPPLFPALEGGKLPQSSRRVPADFPQIVCRKLGNRSANSQVPRQVSYTSVGKLEEPSTLTSRTSGITPLWVCDQEIRRTSSFWLRCHARIDEEFTS